MLQILDPEGGILDPKYLDLLELQAPDYLWLYRYMLLNRTFAKRATEEATIPGHGRKRLMALYISSAGQEAILASTLALNSKDLIRFYARSHEEALARNVEVKALFDVFFGNPCLDSLKNFLRKEVGLPHSLVGAHLPHAVGNAWAAKVLGRKEIAAAYFGEGATATCDFNSALNFSSVHKIPVLFACLNNGWAISTPPHLETATASFAQKALGYGISASVVDGRDALAVWLATKRAVDQIRSLQEPFLIEFCVDRMAPHTTSAKEVRERSPEEWARMRKDDPLRRFKIFLLSEQAKKLGIEWDEEKDIALEEEIINLVGEAAKKSYQELEQAIQKGQGKAVVAKGVRLASLPREPQNVVMPQHEPLVPEIVENVNGRQAIALAIYDSMTSLPASMLIGQDVADIGGVQRVTALPRDFVQRYLPEHAGKIIQKNLPLAEIFGKTRCIDTPLDESGIVGHAIGLAQGGMAVIAEIQFSGFVTVAYHQIVSEAARIQSRYVGIDDPKLNMRLVIRLPDGAGFFIEHHRECVENLFRVPGLVVVYPSTIQDLYDMSRASLEFTFKPVIFLEHKLLYSGLEGRLIRRHPQHSVEKFQSRIAREGQDITVATFGQMVWKTLEAAEILKEKEGIAIEVIDMRVLSPYDPTVLWESVRKTGRIITIEEGPLYGGIGGKPLSGGCGAHFLASITTARESFLSLRSKPIQIGAPWGNFPPPPFWEDYIPQVEDIVWDIKNCIDDTY